MTETKKTKNTFLNSALEAKKNKASFENGKHGKNVPKPGRGFGSTTVVRRSGRGC